MINRPASSTSSDDASSSTTRTRLARLGGIVALVIGSVLLIPAGFYSYLNLRPPEPGPGELYFGDGTGFAVGAFFAVPALAAFVVRTQLLKRSPVE